MKYFTYIKDITPEYQAVFDHNKDCVDFTVFSGKHKLSNSIGPIAWLRSFPDLVWISPNVKIFKVIDFKMIKNTAYLLDNNGKPDPLVMFGNDDHDFFDSVIKNSKHNIASILNYINHKSYRVGLVPDSYFRIINIK